MKNSNIYSGYRYPTQIISKRSRCKSNW